MSAHRYYTIGLPGVISIDDNGRVTLEVDLSEAHLEMLESEEAADRYHSDVVKADGETVSEASRAIPWTAPFVTVVLKPGVCGRSGPREGSWVCLKPEGHAGYHYYSPGDDLSG